MELVSAAALKAAAASGTLSIPHGPVGMLTIIPDLMVVWRTQQQLVADIAAVFGKTADLGKKQMLYCLFRHAAAQAIRDVAVRVGQRVLFKKASLQIIQSVLKRVGVRVTHRMAGRAIARWLPIVGAVGIAGYAYYDTAQVGKTAIELFRSEIVDEDGEDPARQRIPSGELRHAPRGDPPR